MANLDKLMIEYVEPICRDTDGKRFYDADGGINLVLEHLTDAALAQGWYPAEIAEVMVAYGEFIRETNKP
jgi:hypothetical protein